MTAGTHRLLIGGIGGLAPVFALLVAIDFEANLVDASPLKIAGYAVRAVALFLIGGFIAWLHRTEAEPFKLFEIGMGGPALLAGLITTNSLVGGPQKPATPSAPPIAFSFISSAHAQTSAKRPAESAKLPSPPLIKTFTMPEQEGVSAFLQGLVGARPDNVYYVIAGSHLSYESAKSQADRINASRKDFAADVYAPYGDNPYYAVVIGANIKKSEAKSLRLQATQAGLPSDTYLWTFPSAR